MACLTANLSTPPPCLALSSATRQLQDQALLLAAAINALDAGFTIDWDTIRTEALAVAACVPPGVAKAKAAEVIEEGLADADPSVLACNSTGTLQQIVLYLTCTLVDTINP